MEKGWYDFLGGDELDACMMGSRFIRSIPYIILVSSTLQLLRREERKVSVSARASGNTLLSEKVWLLALTHTYV